MQKRQDDYLRSFGRVKSRKITESSQELYDKLFPSLRLNLDDLDQGFAPQNLFDFNLKEVWCEIGFGGGEHLAGQAKSNPEIGIIGCEPFLNGVISLVKHIDENNLKNVKIFDDDARLLFQKIQKESLDRVFVLFPDPWPKARHNKRRLLNENTLEFFAKALKKTGILRIATDHEDYANWIEDLFADSNLFICQWPDRKQSPDDWFETKYQQKAIKEGRSANFFEFVLK